MPMHDLTEYGNIFFQDIRTFTANTIEMKQL